MKKKILLFDGLSIANRAFYGIPLLTNKEGRYTNAVYGFLNIMISMIEKEKPDLVGVAFDVSAPTFRHIQNVEYKGTRKGMPQELREQIPLLKEVLGLMDVHILQKEGFEADDILGTLAKAGERDGYNMVVVSGDRDLLQITSEDIELKIPKTRQQGTEIESYFAKDVVEKYEVSPLEFIDVKGLMGDASDNIKGVPGIGEKTAIKLIKQYHSIENLYEHIDEITQKKLKENLITYKDQALESKMLATIVCDVPLEYTWDEFYLDLTLSEEAEEVFKQLDFKKLIARLPRISATKEVETIEVSKQESLETMGSSECMAITYAYEDGCLELGIAEGKGVNFLSLDLSKDQAEVKTFFEKETGLKVIHDSKKLRHILAEMHIEIKGQVFDTFIAAYLIDPTSETYEISELADNFLGMQNVPSYEELVGKGKSQKRWLGLDENTRVDFLTRRAHILYEAYDVLQKELDKNDMQILFNDIEMPLVKVLFDMEREGIKVDLEKLQAYGKELDALIEKEAERVYELAGESFNINSPKQLGVILFEKMDIPPVKKTKTGYSTAAEVLEKLRDGYPIVEHILAYRQYTKLKSTYVEGLIAVMTSEHKIHSSFNQTITATGRISSTEPNLQNIPVKLEMGRRIRELFIPSSDEYIFLDADYSQIELRVLAALAGDENLIHAFNEGIDIHTLTASQVFHVPFEEVTPLERSNAKAVNFGIVYGIGAFSLSEDLKITQKEAAAYIEGYFEKYPKIKEYLDGCISFARDHGYVKTIFNRKRDIPEINSKNFNLREFGKRKAMNTPIQGTAADIIKLAMVHVHQALRDEGLKSKVILTVHDELLLEVYRPEQEKVAKLLKEKMEQAVNLKVAMSVEVHSGENWLAAK
ncbi:MAG: DNA polymerase I [Zhenhengia sp.]|uniref:DNA polymerase I n=1 Tax=Zhenhengia sp. TaxID=2944208 RepID=UPI002907BE15|nr:DNA polymerase I [Clostridiales bacterium]MDU6973517.1 DNA polymerase I [Clostridiales bacterium]